MGLVFIKRSLVCRLLTPPGTPLFPSLEMDSQKAVMNNEISNARPAALKSSVRVFFASGLVL